MANHQSLPQHGKPSPTLSLMLKEFTEKNLRRHTKATPRPHQSHTKATPKPHQSQLLRLFQRLEGAETACSPRVLAIMRIAAEPHPPLASFAPFGLKSDRKSVV